MGDVIDFNAYKPHLSGEAMCTACEHEWVAVCEVGTQTLECPQCKRGFGVIKNAVVPHEYWECNCGNQLFWLTKDGPQCRMCGVITVDWINS